MGNIVSRLVQSYSWHQYLFYLLALSRRSCSRVGCLIALRASILCLLNVGLLGLSFHLESQGFAVLEEAERCKGYYDEWVKSQKSITSTFGGQQTTSTAANGRQRRMNPVPSPVPHPPHPMPTSVRYFAHTWTGYVERREIEWTFFLLPIAISFIG